MVLMMSLFYVRVGLVVASVCYLQFFPAPSDEKGTRFDFVC